ncbi:PREDICTED: uncharacterized protein LOC104594638 [Nelumbo nucifera]|uniref:Uncharacterized protein LOC104594638 n=2 Tax=Nelumbo nucifera TaxID=4432 RepID=A0A1U7ZXK5_NELNU|nr:PREDICTED: uncharacterized protein LOC104594638 [Nelumbo nucifera]DAD35730.1 TPA_asm: hypothetical protein HUJ06_006370 [Nelumbo nucifera]
MSQMLFFFLSSLLILASLQRTHAGVQYAVMNKAVGTPGGDRFAREIDTQLSISTMTSASEFIWKTLQQSEADRKNVEKVTLIVEVMDVALAYEFNNEIHLSEDFIAKYEGDLKTMFIGIIYHEMTHVWQWNGNGQTPPGLVEGIGDYVRFAAGYAAPQWAKPGDGQKWDEGYSVTARFLEYCNTLSNGFVAKLNAMMKTNYSDHFFVDLLGKTVDQLWNDYKSKYHGAL